MANRHQEFKLGQMRKLLTAQQRGRLTDQQLLQQFLVAKEDAAFGALVERHGSMV